MTVETLSRKLFRLGGAIAAAALVTAASAEAAQSTGGVQWLDPLTYEKPVFYPLTLPTIATNYYIDMSAGSDSASCGTCLLYTSDAADE